MKRDAHHTIYVIGATPPPPSGREHPEGLPIPPCLWKTLWITPYPVDNPVENYHHT